MKKGMNRINLMALVMALVMIVGCIGFAEGEFEQTEEVTVCEVIETVEPIVEEEPVIEEAVPAEPAVVKEETIPEEQPVEEKTEPAENDVVEEVEPVQAEEEYTVRIYIANLKETYNCGDIVRIESVIEGTCTNPTYQWQVKMPGSSKWMDIEKATKSCFEFAVDEHNFYNSYKVVVTNHPENVE